MICKFCGLDGLHWGENWKKGDRPLEPDTNIMHTTKRCKDVQSRNIIKKTDGWIRKVCVKCHNLVLYSRKHYTDKTINSVCSECLIKSKDMVRYA